MRFAPALLLLLAAPALAQDPIPDTTEAWRYYPLQIGNVWEYDEVRVGEGPPCWYAFPCRYVSAEEVVADTLVEGEVYSVIEVTRVQTEPQPLPPQVYRELIRFDTLASTLVWLDPQPFWGACRFDEAFPADPETGREIECPQDDPAVLLLGGYGQVVEIGDDVVTVAVKEYQRGFHGYEVDSRYAADIGLVYEEAGDVSSVERWLHYARVDSVEYGLPSGVANEPDAQRSSFRLASYPSPFAGLVTLDLAVPTPQAVTIEVFDGLGRRVYAEEHSVAGPARLVLDGQGWAPGVYVVRVTTAEGQQAQARLVRQ